MFHCEAVRSAILATAWLLVCFVDGTFINVFAVTWTFLCFVCINRVIGTEGCIFCTGQHVGWENRLPNDLAILCWHYPEYFV